MFFRYRVSNIVYIGWCVLGFRRGVEYYDKMYNNTSITPHYLPAILCGIVGCGIYATPYLIPVTLHIELYRM